MEWPTPAQPLWLNDRTQLKRKICRKENKRWTTLITCRRKWWYVVITHHLAHFPCPWETFLTWRGERQVYSPKSSALKAPVHMNCGQNEAKFHHAHQGFSNRRWGASAMCDTRRVWIYMSFSECSTKIWLNLSGDTQKLSEMTTTDAHFFPMKTQK